MNLYGMGSVRGATLGKRDNWGKCKLGIMVKTTQRRSLREGEGCVEVRGGVV